MQYDLSDCSIVIPVEVDCPERLEHIHFQYAFFKRYFVRHHLIIIEQGKEPQVHLPPAPNVQIEFVLKGREAFCTSLLCNQGIALVKTPYFCKCDADAAIHPKAIYEAFELLKNQPGQAFVLPFNGIFLSLFDPLRKEVLQTGDVSSLPFITRAQGAKIAKAPRGSKAYSPLPHATFRYLNMPGLIHHFRTKIFQELGGYNEEFIGWGCEDHEIIDRFRILGHPKTHLPNYNVFHFEHPRKEPDPHLLLQNHRIWQSIRRSSPEEIRESIQNWSRFKN